MSVRSMLPGIAERFLGGALAIVRLCPADYHRYHFPVGGTVKEIRIIPGINPTGGVIWWDDENNRCAFNPSAKTGWQPFHLILNIAVGGAWGRAGGPVDDSIFPLRMEVDYARVYQKRE